MRIVVFDIETPPIPRHTERIHCIVTREVGQKPRTWAADNYEEFKEYAKTVDRWVAHNGISFDVPTVNTVLDLSLPTTWPGLIDTFVVSRLINYKRYNGHGLDEIGESMGVKKSKFNDFEELSEELLERCVGDVDITMRFYLKHRKYIESEKWNDAMQLEHDVVLICEDIRANGFAFDTIKAQKLLADIRHRMDTIEPVFQNQWPPVLVEDRRIQYRVNKDGTPNATMQKSIDNAVKWELDGNEVVIYRWKEFNPGSTKDRVEKLWESGWKPYEKSDTHKKFARAKVGDIWGKQKLTPKFYEEKKAYFDYYGWKVCEENLLTLPDEAPEGAHLLAEWLTLEGRRSPLETWLGCVQEDGRIHPKLWFIGAWTQRMSHSDPNCANISAPFHGEPRNAVEEVKKLYDADLRSCWTVADNALLVGTDADGIQLRILAHYLKNDDYVNAIVNGRKEDGTDIHNLNLRALGLEGIERDHAKTFIYAWLLGARTERVAGILHTTRQLASGAMESFVENTHGLGS